MTHPHVLFVCVQNAGRSQIAQALFTSMSGGRGEARSAGSRPADALHPHVAAALTERGFEVSSVHPRRLTIEDADWADVVVTMGCGDECPATGKPTEDWDLPDPKDMSGPELDAVIDEISVRVREFLNRLGDDIQVS